MSINDSRLLALAIEGLQAQRRLIDEELAQLQARLGGGGGAAKATASKAGKGRRKRSSAQRKAHSERMKKIWAERKRAKK